MSTQTTTQPWTPDRPEDATAAIFQALGAASTCWESLTHSGVFQDQQATAIGNGLIAWLDEHRPAPTFTAEQVLAATHAADDACLAVRTDDQPGYALLLRTRGTTGWRQSFLAALGIEVTR